MLYSLPHLIYRHQSSPTFPNTGTRKYRRCPVLMLLLSIVALSPGRLHCMHIIDFVFRSSFLQIPCRSRGQGHRSNRRNWLGRHYLRSHHRQHSCSWIVSIYTFDICHLVPRYFTCSITSHIRSIALLPQFGGASLGQVRG